MGITQIEKVGEQSFFHMVCHIDMIYNTNKYNQNISKGIEVMEQTRVSSFEFV